MRESHQEQIERWAKFVRDNPTKWKSIHTKFIDAIFLKHREVIDRIRKMPNGEERIKELQKL